MNVRRREVGLEPLEEYAKRFGLVYTLPKEDSLKGKVVLKSLVFSGGKPLEGVKVLPDGKILGYTDSNGRFELFMDRSSLKPLFTLNKDGYESATYTIDNLERDIFQIAIGLQRN